MSLGRNICFVGYFTRFWVYAFKCGATTLCKHTVEKVEGDRSLNSYGRLTDLIIFLCVYNVEISGQPTAMCNGKVYCDR